MSSAEPTASSIGFSRLFVSVQPPSETLDTVGRAASGWRRQFDSPAVRWTPPEQWHLTLQFLGQVADARIGRLGDALRQALVGHSPFELSLGSLGAFPSPARPRVIWLGLQGDLLALRRLQASVAEAAGPWVESPDPKPFHPHLTLARVRDPRAIARWNLAAPGWAGAAIAPASARWQVESIELMRSHLAPGGARHQAVQGFALR